VNDFALVYIDDKRLRRSNDNKNFTILISDFLLIGCSDSCNNRRYFRQCNPLTTEPMFCDSRGSDNGDYELKEPIAYALAKPCPKLHKPNPTSRLHSQCNSSSNENTQGNATVISFRCVPQVPDNIRTRWARQLDTGQLVEHPVRDEIEQRDWGGRHE
jgi:hypothetical protein